MFSTPAVAGTLVVIASCGGSVFALDRTSGRLRWRHDPSSYGERHPGLTYHGDMVVTTNEVVVASHTADGSSQGLVFSVELATGRRRWKHAVGDGGVTGDVVRAGDRVYIVTLMHDLVCLDLQSGKARWAHQSGQAGPALAFPGPSAAVLRGAVAFAKPDGTVTALGHDGGRVMWRTRLPATATSSLTAFSGRLYLGADDDNIYALSSISGAVEARLGVGKVIAPPLVVGERLVVLTEVGGLGAQLRAVDRDLQRVLWSTEALSGFWSSSRPYYDGQHVIAGSTSGDLVAIRPRDGSIVGSLNLGPGLQAIRGIGFDARTFYVGTKAGWLLAVPSRALTVDGKVGSLRQLGVLYAPPFTIKGELGSWSEVHETDR